MKLNVDVDISDALAELGGVAARAANVRPVMERARARAEQLEASIFASQGGAVGGWAPLSPQYAAWKAVAWGTPMMVQTGELLEDLTNFHGPGSDVDADGAKFAVNAKHAKFHQHGTRYMPARQLWPENGDAVWQTFTEWIAEQIDDWVDPGVDL